MAAASLWKDTHGDAVRVLPPRRWERAKGFRKPSRIFFPRPNPLRVAKRQEERCNRQTGKDHVMPHRLIRYRAKPEKAEENQRLIEGVFRELHAKSPAQVRYLVLRLSDGTFCHLVDDSTKTVPTLEAFAAFQRGGAERRLDEPQQLEATVVGNYRMLIEP
jgi:hypothetical protein